MFRAFSLVLLTGIAVSGCVDEDVPDAAGVSDLGPTPSSTEPPARPIAAPRHVYEAVEFELAVTFGISGPGLFQGPMEEMMEMVDVPVDANVAWFNATWTPSVPVSTRQDCMLHLGTNADMGTMLAGAHGASPLSMGPMMIPAENRTVVYMCFVEGEPVGAEVLQKIHVRAEFAFEQTERQDELLAS